MKCNHSAFAAAALVCALGSVASASVPDDARIAATVRRSFVYKHYLKNDDIKVASRDGVVTLTGSVSEEFHKNLADEAAAAQSGVVKVDDRLTVAASAPAAGSDAWLTGKVKTALLFHRSVSAVATKVESKDGVVTLSGVADSQAEKDLTTEYVRDVDGVKDVVNGLTVAKAPSRTRRMERKIDDASITSEVKLTLLFHRSTSAVDTKVSTSHGVVTLSGKATSMAEKDLSEKIVGDVKGVKSVKNDLAVE
jgi:hyperosmotically inducible protein